MITTEELSALLIAHDCGSIAGISTGAFQLEEVVDSAKRYFSNPINRSALNPNYVTFANAVHEVDRPQLIEAYELAFQIWNKQEVKQ